MCSDPDKWAAKQTEFALKVPEKDERTCDWRTGGAHALKWSGQEQQSVARWESEHFTTGIKKPSNMRKH